jgi:hypothetical protein
MAWGHWQTIWKHVSLGQYFITCTKIYFKMIKAQMQDWGQKLNKGEY